MNLTIWKHGVGLQLCDGPDGRVAIIFLSVVSWKRFKRKPERSDLCDSSVCQIRELGGFDEWRIEKFTDIKKSLINEVRFYRNPVGGVAQLVRAAES